MLFGPGVPSCGVVSYWISVLEWQILIAGQDVWCVQERFSGRVILIQGCLLYSYLLESNLAVI